MTGSDWCSEFLGRTLAELRDHIAGDVQRAVASIIRGLPLESILAGLGPGFWKALGQCEALHGFPMPREECYRLLGLSHDASMEEVERRYRELAKRLHPDLAGPETAHLFGLVHHAYRRILEGE